MKKTPATSHNGPGGKPLSRKELAMLVFPGYAPDTASQMLSRWIARDDDLRNDLLRTGYRSGQRILTPIQIDIFSDHFGL